MLDFIPITFIDIIDIALVALFMFGIYRATRGTNVPYIVTGVLMIYLLWIVVRLLGMELLSSILGQVVSVGVIALIILFQPEIRRFLQIIGMRRKRFGFLSRFFTHTHQEDSSATVTAITTACTEMASSKTGALIVINGQSDLNLIIEGGIAVDAKISTPLLENIFFKNSPLHDGAVVINGGRIVAAKCILPVTQTDVPKSYGTRHRAAIGMSEISDALIVAVSEETGRISVALDSALHRNISVEELSRLVRRQLRKENQ